MRSDLDPVRSDKNFAFVTSLQDGHTTLVPSSRVSILRLLAGLGPLRSVMPPASGPEGPPFAPGVGGRGSF